MSANKITNQGGYIIFNNNETELSRITVNENSNLDVNNKSIVNLVDSIRSDSAVTKNYVNSRTKGDIGLSNVQNILSNYNAIAPPSQVDDVSKGYSVGSRWIDLSTNNEFVCLNNANNNAVWGNTTSTEDALSAANIVGEGVGVFKQKVSGILEFKRITSTNKLIVSNSINNVILDIDESNVDIQNLKNAPTGSIVGLTDAQVLSNKTIDVLTGPNTILNLGNENIRDGANIDASKIGTGSVTNTEFGYLDGLTGNIQTQMDTHTNNFSNPHNVTKAQVGLKYVEDIKNNYMAAGVPGAVHDIMNKYSVGSKWINSITGKEYVCVDNTLNNAVWKETTNLGEIITVTNLGSGNGLYKEKIGSDLKFKSLTQGSNVILTSNDNDITIKAKNTHSFLLLPTIVEAYSLDYSTVVYFPWKNSFYSTFINGKIVFGVDIIGAGLDVRVYNSTENSVLGEIRNISSTGVYSLATAGSSDDAIIVIQIRKNNNGTDPRIYGITMIFDD